MNKHETSYNFGLLRDPDGRELGRDRVDQQATSTAWELGWFHHGGGHSKVLATGGGALGLVRRGRASRVMSTRLPRHDGEERSARDRLRALAFSEAAHRHLARPRHGLDRRDARGRARDDASISPARSSSVPGAASARAAPKPTSSRGRAPTTSSCSTRTISSNIPPGTRLPELDRVGLHAADPRRAQRLSTRRIQILKSAHSWRYEGVRHEYAVCDDATFRGPRSLDGIVYRRFWRRRAPEADPQKYLKDAAALEEDLLRDPTNARSVFYLARSYEDGGELPRALAQYERRVLLGGWDEEVFFAAFCAARVREKLGFPREAVARAYLARGVGTFGPHRAGAAPSSLARLRAARRGLDARARLRGGRGGGDPGSARATCSSSTTRSTGGAP